MKHSIINAVILLDVLTARTPFVSYHVEVRALRLLRELKDLRFPSSLDLNIEGIQGHMRMLVADEVPCLSILYSPIMSSECRLWGLVEQLQRCLWFTQRSRMSHHQ